MPVGLETVMPKELNVKDHLFYARWKEDMVSLEGREDEEWRRGAGPLEECDQNLPYDLQILGSFYVSLKAT